MKTNRCVNCLEEFSANFKTNVCGKCESPKAFGFPTLKETISLYTMANVSKARVKELDRRVMLPEKVPGKDCNYVGRSVRGKIQDKEVDIRP